MKISDIAMEIDAHLRRLEYEDSEAHDPERLLYHPSASPCVDRVHIDYHATNEPVCGLTTEEATAYLDRLNAGFTGKHYEE